jgi:hypothetical protein
MTSVPDSSDTGSISDTAEKRECLLVVGGYDRNTKLLKAVAEEAQKGVMTSPTLEDFIQVRFVDMGSRPEGPGSQPGALARVAHELVHPRDGAALYYFAFVVIDKSAAVVERVLRDCASDSVMSALPIRFRGLATVEDRPHDGDNPDTAGAEIMLPEAGQWGPEGLITQVLRYAEALFHDFPSGQEPGLSRERLDELQRTASAALRAAEAAPADASARAGHEGARSGERRPVPDMPVGYSVSGGPWPSAPVLADTRGQPRRSATARPEKAQRGLVGTVVRFVIRIVAVTMRFVIRVVAATLRFVIRTVARLARPGGPPRTTSAAPTADSTHLVLLILVSQSRTPDAEAHDRAQPVFREVERSLAAAGGRWVHTIWTADGVGVERLRPAGRHAPGAGDSGPGGLDLAGAVDAARTVLGRDVAALEGSSWTVGSSAVVLYTEDVPLADPRTVEVFGDIVQTPRAHVAWVVPKGTADLIAPQLRRGVRVIEAHRRVAEEITSFLLDPARTRPPDHRSSHEPAP